MMMMNNQLTQEEIKQHLLKLQIQIEGLRKKINTDCSQLEKLIDEYLSLEPQLVEERKDNE